MQISLATSTSQQSIYSRTHTYTQTWLGSWQAASLTTTRAALAPLPPTEQVQFDTQLSLARRRVLNLLKELELDGGAGDGLEANAA